MRAGLELSREWPTLDSVTVEAEARSIDLADVAGEAAWLREVIEAFLEGGEAMKPAAGAGTG